MKSISNPQSLLFTVAACLVLCAATVRAGVVTNIFTFQKGNLQTNGVAYGSGASYSGVVDGAINDNNATTALATGSTNTLGTAFASGNGRQYCGLFSYDLTELNTFIAANTGPYSSVVVTSVAFQLLSAGGNTGSATGIGLYGTDPFTSSCTWSNYTTGTPWTVPYQNIGSSAQYGYTGGGSTLTPSLGGASPNTGVTAGNLLTWTSSANFITAVTNALARGDKTLYLTANSSLGNTDHRLNFNCSSVGTVSYRPALTITLQITTTAAWTGASSTSWATAGNWSPSGVPATDTQIFFNSSSTANLSTVLNQNFAIANLTMTTPSGPVSIGGANSLTIDTSSGIDLSGANQDLTITAPVVLGVAQTWNVAASRTLSVNGGVSGSVGLTVSGAGKVSLGGAASHTGNTTVSAGGTLHMGADNVLPNLAGGGNVNVNGVLDLNGHPESVNGLTGSGVVDNTAVGAATLTVGNNNTNSTFSGTIQNTGGALVLLKTGTGSLTLSGTNIYSGGTTIANGTVTPGNGSAFGTGTVTNSGTAYPAASMTITNPLVLNGGYLRVGGSSDTVNWTGPVTVANGFVMGGDNNGNVNNVSGPIDIGTGGIYVTNNTGNGQAQAVLGDILSGTISGSSGITYYCNGGNSRLTVQGANSYSGGTIVNGTSNGKLNVYGGLNPFSTGTVTLNAGAVIEAYPGSVTITNALNLSGGILEGESQYNDYNRLTWAGPIILTANSTLFQFGQNNGQMSQGVNVSGPLNLNGFTLTNTGNSGLYNGSIISGPISGTGTILENVNILYLSGSNTFSGTFRAVGGNITVQNVNAMQNATLDMNAADSGSVTLMSGAVIGALTGSRNLNMGGLTVLIGNNNSSTTYNGALTNTGSFTKVGIGTLTLSGANTYTGNTTISGGTLALSGSGSLASPVIAVASGAALDTSAATFTLGSGQILSNTASATAQLVGPLSSGSGTLSVSFVNGTPSFNVTGSALTLSASTVIAVRNTGATLAPGIYKIISKSGVGAVAGTPPASVSVINGPTAGTPSVAIVGGELYLTVGGTSNFSYGSTSLAYNGAAQGPTVSYSGSTAAKTTNYVGVSVSYGPSVNAPTNAGTYYVSNTVATDANYFGATNSQSFTIDAASLGITANNASKSYGQTVTFAGTEFTPSGLVGGDSVSSVTLTSSGTTNTATPGSYDIVVSAAAGSGLANYSISYTNGTLTVNPAALLVQADNAGRAYGATNPVFTVSISGFVNSETLGTSDVGGAPSLTTAADTNSPVGTYNIVAAVDSLTSTNYSFVFSNGTLTVAQAAITVTADNQSRAYGATNPALTVNYSGFLNGDTTNVLSGSPTVTTPADTNSPVGSYAITPAQGALSATNYAFNFVNGTLTVTTTSLTIIANDDSKTYDGTGYTGGNGVTYSGFVNGETSANLGGTLVYGGTSQNATNAGSYTIVPSGLSNTNYAISFVNGALTISQAVSVITAAPMASAITYGQMLSDSVLSGGSATPSGGNFAFTAPSTIPPVGTAAYGVTYTPLDTVNYTTATTNVSVTVNSACTSPAIVGGISPGGLTATVGDQVVLTVTNVTGTSPLSYQWLNNAVAIASATNSSYTNLSVLVADAGNYQVVITNDCGAITSSVAVLTVNLQTPLIATLPTAATITYGQTLSAATLSGGSVTNAAGAAITGNFAYTNLSLVPNAGTAAQGIAFTPDDTTNYTAISTAVNVTVTPAALSVTANNAAKTYGQTVTFAGTEISTCGLTNGDSVTSVTITSAGAMNTAIVGTYPIVPSAASGTGLGNYTISYTNGTLTVNTAVLGVMADDASRAFGAANPAFTASYTGFVNGDTITVVSGTPSLTTTADTNSLVGTYLISAALGSLTATNYTFSLTNGTLTVTPAAITVTADNQSRTYGTANPAFTASYAGFVNGDTSSVISGTPTLTTAADTNSPVGSYVITNLLGSLSATNYSFTLVNGTLTVTTAALGITANADSKTYDGTGYTGGNGVTYAGFVNGETSSVLGGTLVYGGTSQNATNAGSYSIIPSGLTPANYAVSYTNGTLTINPLGVTVTSDGQTKVYGASDPTLTYSYTTALIAGDSFNGSLTRTTGESVGSYGINQGSLALSANYTLTYNGTNLVITPAALGITANSASKNYGQTVTFAGTGFTTSGLQFSDSVTSVTITSAGATNTAAVGTYPIVPGAASGTGLGNYTISYVNGILTVNAASAVTVNSPVPLPDGNFQLTFTGGDNGVGYQIQASEALGSTVWSILATNVATLGGIPSYTDRDATNHPARFYRTVVP